MKIVAIGGGTGTTAVLKGLKEYTDLDVSAIVTMMDDGGSNAVVRDEFGMLPLSDLRKSILALSEDNKNEILRQLFMYRFDKGNGISGHTLGNLIMVALTDITGNEKDAVKQASQIFDVVGQILPVTLDKVRLIAKYSDGSRVVGEHHIDEPDEDKRIVKLSLSGKAIANDEAVTAILDAEFIVIGPGDLYTSILPNILVDGIAHAIRKSKGKVIYISNLMSKKGETRGLSHSDLVHEIEKYCGRAVDYVFLNNTPYSKDVLKKYVEDGEAPIPNDFTKENTGKRKVIEADLISSEEIKREKGDILKRSLIRHDSDKLAKELYQIFRRGFFEVIADIIKLN